MAGNPHEGTSSPRTVLEHILWGEDYSYEEIAARFDLVASELGERASITGRHLRRLASGERTGANPVTRRVLQAMFGYSAEHLFSPWQGGHAPGPPAGELFGLGSSSESSLSPQDREALSDATRRAHDLVLQLSNTNANPEAMDQLRDDVAYLAASYQRLPPGQIVGKLAETQDELFRLLEGRQAPGHTRQLLLLAGISSGLLAKISHDLADPQTAMTHTRTAYLCADNADHNGLRAWVRGLQSLIAYWAGRYNEAIRYAQQGAQIGATNSSSVWLPLNEARAWAALENVPETIRAIRDAESARELTVPDEIDELGGICTFSSSKQLYYSAEALMWLPHEAQASEALDAERYANDAVLAYSDSTAADWCFGDAAGSSADLAVARIHRGEVEGAAEALGGVLQLPAEKRINGIVASVDNVYRALRSAPRSAEAKNLQEEIETFKARPLRALGPGA